MSKPIKKPPPMSELERNPVTKLERRLQLEDRRVRDFERFESRTNDNSMFRFLTLVEQEAALEKAAQMRTNYGRTVDAQKKKEEDLGLAIAKARDEENLELMRRTFLRENADELKNLMTKLRASYVSRDQKQQILRNEYKRFQEKQEDFETAKVLNDARLTEAKASEEAERKKLLQQSKYGKELRQQIVNSYARKQCMYEDTLIEMKMLEDIEKTISDEDKRELQRKQEQKAQLHRDNEMTQACKQAWREKEKKSVILENMALQTHQIELDKRVANIQARKNMLQAQKEAIYKKITYDMIAAATKDEDKQNFIMDLAQNEALEKSINADLSEMNQLKKMKSDTMRELTAQMRERVSRNNVERLQDEQYRLHFQAQILGDSQKELEKERKKKEKQLQYTKDLRKQLQDNETRRKKMKEAEDALTKYVLDYQLTRKGEVLKERERIVEEHVPHVMGYLHAGVIGREDLPAVRRGANKHGHLASMDIESIYYKSVPQRTRPKCNAQCHILKTF